MKALFLDIDGVIATPASMRKSYSLGREPENMLFDTIALMYVGRLVQRTGAKVVLSSTWREDLDSNDPLLRAIVDNLCRQLEAVGAPLFDVTPKVLGGDRSSEIGAWLDAHPCEAWAILDDRATFEQRPDVCEGHLVLIEKSDGLRHQHYLKTLAALES